MDSLKRTLEKLILAAISLLFHSAEPLRKEQHKLPFVDYIIFKETAEHCNLSFHLLTDSTRI